MNIEIEQDSLIVFVGAMGTGKSTFARKHFAEHSIVETDFIRKQLTGNFEDQSQNSATFKILYATIDARAEAGLLTVIDSTGSRGVLDNVRNIGNKYKRPLVIIQFPHLEESELTEERMKHRMRYLFAYERQVERIDKTDFHPDYERYVLTDINKDTITFKGDKNLLDPSEKYVVIPDLHGEYEILEKTIKRYEGTGYKFIFLGDIVDRGKSPYKTFKLVKSLIDNGDGFCVVSNHDNKFYRYIKKWLADATPFNYNPLFIPQYGMTLSHGLDVTINEFFSLKDKDQDYYANDFVSFYESLPSHLILKKNGIEHYFAHASVSYNVALGMKPTKTDFSEAMYTTIQNAEEVTDRFKSRIDDNITVHIGHNYKHDDILISTNGNHEFIMHDIGIGKRKIDYLPDFYEIT